MNSSFNLPSGDIHYMDILLDGRKPDWERARLRLDTLTDEQILEAAKLTGAHGGSGVPDDFSAAKWRKNLPEALDGIKDITFGEKGSEDMFFAHLESIPGHWENDTHKTLFLFAAMGVLQAAGYKVDGYNIPVYSYEDPIDYWPEEGLTLFWEPALPEGWPPTQD